MDQIQTKVSVISNQNFMIEINTDVFAFCPQMRFFYPDKRHFLETLTPGRKAWLHMYFLRNFIEASNIALEKAGFVQTKKVDCIIHRQGKEVGFSFRA